MFSETGTKTNHVSRSFVICLAAAAAGALGYFCYKDTANLNSIFLGTTVLLVFYGFCFLALHKEGAFRVLRQLTAKEKIYSLLLILALNVFTYFQMIHEKTIYYWDSSTYWEKTIQVSRRLFDTPNSLMQQVYQSVNTNDYNMIIPLVLALPTKIFGEEHTAYVLMNLNLFVIPCALIIALTAKQRGGEKAPPFPLLLGIVLLLPALTFPVIVGYLDAFSLLTLALAFVLVIRDNLFHFDPGLCVLLAAAFLLSILGRRYFVYPVIGITAACGMLAVVYLAEKRIDFRSFLSFTANFLLIGCICFAVLYGLFKPFLYHAVFGSYAQKYSAYQKGTYFYNLLLFAEYFGILFTAVWLFGTVRSFQNKNRAYPAFLISTILISISMFFQVQSMDAHHYYIAVIPVLLLLLEAFCPLRNCKPAGRKAAAGVLLAVMGINFLFAYVKPLSQVNCALVTAAQYRPLYRDDLQTVQKLADRLNTLSRQKNNAKVYLLSSSKILNYSTLQNVDAPKTFEAVPELYSSEEVDKRDGFPYQFLRADIVVVCDPVQYCLAPKDQQVVGLLADDVLREKQFADNYSLIEVYTLKDSVKAKVYRKTSPFSASDLKYVENQFNRSYPGWKLHLVK